MKPFDDSATVHRVAREDEQSRRGMPRPGEPTGFFARLTAAQEAKVLAYRGDDRVGEPGSVPRPAKTTL